VENGTTILFGLPGVAVDRVEQAVDGARTVHIVTADPDAAACPACGTISTSVRQRRITRPKDLPYGEAPLEVRWHKRQYRCVEPWCARKAFTEQIDELPAGARITGRCRRAAATAIGSGRSVSAVCAELPLSWPIAHAAYVAHADALLLEPAPPRVLGIDETRRGRPRWVRDEHGNWQRLERFETNFVDLSGTGGLLGQVAGRTSAAMMAWLNQRGDEWKAQVQVVAIDPCAAYRSAVQQALPHATLVADPFHIVKLANDMVTDTRQRVAREQLGRRGRKKDPAWANRRLLLRAGDRLSPRALARLGRVLASDSDPTQEIAAAWAVKERLRMLLAASDRHTIAHRLHRFHETVLAADLPEATRLAETIDVWWPQILAQLQTRISNAGTEGTNRLIKDAARIAFGFRNLENQRRRVRSLHPAITPANQCRGGQAPSTLKSRFTCPVRAEQGEDLALRDIEADRVNGLNGTIGERQFHHPDDIGHLPSLR
jgi:transposase